MVYAHTYTPKRFSLIWDYDSLEVMVVGLLV